MLRRNIKIAIIDSGIDVTKSDLNRYVVKSTGIRIDSNGYIIEDDSMKLVHEHGTAIALTIKHIFEYVEFISINILNERLSTDGRVLICALQQALQYEIDIIHLSLGTTKWRYKYKLNKLVKEASKKGAIVVSAADNHGVKSYPAYIKGVVGVKGFMMDDYSKIDYYHGFFYAPTNVKKIEGIDELVTAKYAEGNSLAAGYISGHIAALKYFKDIDNNNITKLLKFQAQKLRGVKI